MASISSMNTMQGAFSLACLNRSLTRAAPTPTYTCTNSEPETEMKGTPASPATALASRVLPVPGGPLSRHPLGILAPMAVYLSGLLRKSTTSSSSILAESQPATSAKLVLVTGLRSTLALDLAKDVGSMPPWPLPPPRPPPGPPPPPNRPGPLGTLGFFFMFSTSSLDMVMIFKRGPNRTVLEMRAGITSVWRALSTSPSGTTTATASAAPPAALIGATLISTLCCTRKESRLGSLGMSTVNRSPSLSTPTAFLPSGEKVTFSTSFFSTSSRNLEYTHFSGTPACTALGLWRATCGDNVGDALEGA
mmetsp:Transcript_13528/g.30299  ORF Transcript_13528/g.30299 Transcript_13528/m.30299 type:complete len:306 (-) Transcript_13528:293-1210(-)